MKPIKFGRQSDIFACTALGVYFATGTFRRVMVFALAYAIAFLFINAAIFVFNRVKLPLAELFKKAISSFAD